MAPSLSPAATLLTCHLTSSMPALPCFVIPVFRPTPAFSLRAPRHSGPGFPQSFLCEVTIQCLHVKLYAAELGSGKIALQKLPSKLEPLCLACVVREPPSAEPAAAPSCLPRPSARAPPPARALPKRPGPRPPRVCQPAGLVLPQLSPSCFCL